MATGKRRCCAHGKQCRVLALYAIVSVFILCWIYAMNYGTVVDFNGYLGGNTETAPGGFRLNVDTVLATVTKNQSSQSVIWNRGQSSGFRKEPMDFHFSEKSDPDLDRLKEHESFCNGRFVGYGQTFAKLSQVVIDPHYGQGRPGGENISDVINQAESSEYYRLKQGYFRLFCKAMVSYSFNGPGHLNDWMNSLKIITDKPASSSSARQTNWAIAVTRYEYANLYHTMTDYYNAFLLAKIFKMDIGNITIIWIDGHPVGALDSTWNVLFGKVFRASDFHAPVLFDNLAWNIVGYKSPMHDHSLPRVPCLEEFREFFLHRHGISTDHQLDCQNLNVLFLWRRDYLAHPRNPSGQVSRKIKNEEELENAIRTRMGGHTIQGIQLDSLPMQNQLEIISSTDILIGMHGAGLAHTLFLPKHGGLVELYPTYWPSANRHFRAMAQWRNLKYSNWINSDQSREFPNHYTRIDVKAVANIVHEMHHKLCDDKVHN